MANYIIFGGTFDPVHNGHMRIALASSLRLNADVIFVPSKSPRWKNPLTSSEHRLKMLSLAIKHSGSSSFSIDKYELNSGDDINYSIDTVRYFKKKYPKDNLYFLIGADQVDNFYNWKDAYELSKLVQIVYVSRPNVTIDKNAVEAFHMIDLYYDGSGPISSSSIRDFKSIDVPTEVLEYIEKNHLYFVDKVSRYVDEARLAHSIQVAKLAYLIAKKNKLENPEKYYIAGLLHDVGKIAKNKEKMSAISFMNKYYSDYLDLPPFSFHQFIGEKIAREDFNINDEEILKAIKYHSTGNANMSDLAMVVYASDKIEPTRGFDSRWLINSCMKNYKQGFIDTLIDNKKYLLAHNKDIYNRLTDACFKMYIGEK